MANTSRAGALKTALVEALRNEAALAGVHVYSAELPTHLGPESIQLIGEDVIDQEWAEIGRAARDEQITLVGLAWAQAPGVDQEEAIQAARDRVFELVAVVEGLCHGAAGINTFGGLVKAAKCRPAELVELYDTENRIAMLRFEIRTEKTRLVP